MKSTVTSVKKVGNIYDVFFKRLTFLDVEIKE